MSNCSFDLELVVYSDTFFNKNCHDVGFIFGISSSAKFFSSFLLLLLVT